MAAGAASFTPSPEILFLVQQQAKTLSTLSAISKRLEELEVKVCDIQRTMATSSCRHATPAPTATGSELHVTPASSSSKCSANGQQNVLSDDSGGEYSRTTNGTTVDEDELISLLDQIAKYSQTIRETQQSQAQAQLASLSPGPSAAAAPRVPDTRRRDAGLLQHNATPAPDHHPSSSPAALMTDHHVARPSVSRLNHHPHLHNQPSSSQSALHSRNQSLTHANLGTRGPASAAFPVLRPSAAGSHHLHQLHHASATDVRSGDRVAGQLASHQQSSAAAAGPPAPAADSSSSLGALLFDPNLSSVLANLLPPPRTRTRDPF